MIQPLFVVMSAEMGVILLLLFKTPLRKLLIMGLDRLKRGRAPLVVKSVGATVFVIMMYTIYAIQEIHSRQIEAINPTDQVLMANHMLEASLMGFCLFLALMVDRLHHYMRELHLLRKTMEASKKQSQASDGDKNGNPEELEDLDKEISASRAKIEKRESDHKKKEKELKAAETNSIAIQNRYDRLLLEYGRLLEENQNLRNVVQPTDQTSSDSDGKKHR